MDLGIMTEPHLGGTYEEQRSVARWAEDHGLTAFARCDHLLAGRDPRPAATDAFSVLAGLARETTTIELTVLVAPITFRHPAILAKSAATIHEMSGGRFRLGVGTGWMELEHDALGIPFPESAQRWALMEEALQYLRATIDLDHARFEGDHFRIDAELKPRPVGLPLIVGGSGSHRTPRIAGTYADEYNHFVATPEALEPKIARVRQAADAAGRDPESIRVSLMGPILVGSDRADFESRLREAAAARDRSPDEHEAVLTKAGVPCGTPDQLKTQLSALEAVGVDLFYAQFLDVADLDGMTEQMLLIM